MTPSDEQLQRLVSRLRAAVIRAELKRFPRPVRPARPR
ncbi:MAG: hypothetical protein JWQ97_2334 [Phenylobacterium sp.]|nr:hypothetical protein [Phenylobacterium sp.]